MCPRREPFSCGIAYLNPAFRRVFDLNLMKVERPPEAGARELALEADELSARYDLLHRQIWIDDEEVGCELAPGFEELGWRVDRHVAMTHRRPPRRDARAEVVEVTEDEVWPSRETWFRTYEDSNDDEVIEQMRRQYGLFREHFSARDFGVVIDGRVVSFALLFSDGRTGQIEDVATLTEHRKQGYATAVVLRALSESKRAGHDLTFLIADDEDWPKDLYAKLGFEETFRQYYFLKTNMK